MTKPSSRFGPNGATRVLLATAAALASASLGLAPTAADAASVSQLTIEGSTSPIPVLNLNPFNGTTGVDLMYSTLMLVDPVNGSMAPELATSFKALNAKTLAFTIRKGVHWSNGTPFSPADVVFTFNMLKKNPALDTGGVWNELSSVTSSGDRVVFHLKVADVPLGLSLASVPIVSQAKWSKVANPTKYTAQQPVVTGPYTLGSFAPTKLVLKKNPTSFEASKVKPATVAFLTGSSSQATNELLVASGTYDFSYNYFPDVKTTFVARNPAHNVYWFPPGGVVSLFVNLTEAPFTSVDFRKGVSYAISRRAVENKAVFGVEKVAPQTGLMLPNEDSWVDPAIPGRGFVYRNDSTALSYFKKAGYTKKGGKLVGPDGKQVSFSIVVPNNYSDWVGAAQQIATNLGQVGIHVTLDEPTAAVYTSATEAGEFEAAMGSFGGSGSAYSAFDPWLGSSFAAPLKTATVTNFERFKSPAVDQDLATLAAATTTTASTKATYALEKVMYDEVPFINLYYGGMWGLFSTRHWVGWPSEKNPYTLPATWDDDLLAILMHVHPA